MRRTLLGWLFRNKPNRCYWCGRKLTEIEKEHYDNSCERCESKITKYFWKE